MKEKYVKSLFSLSSAIVLLFTLLTFFTFFTGGFTTSVSAHAIFPPEVVEFIEKNPNVTDAELDEFFTKKYGYSLDEYFTKQAEAGTPVLYDANFDVMAPSQEYLDLQKNAKNQNTVSSPLNSESKLKEVTQRAFEKDAKFQALSAQEKNVFLENVLKLKYQQTQNGKSDSLWVTLKTYIIIGIEHILSGPDHILFVISLLLLPFAFRRILILISVFTVSHSLTLILAGLNIITLSSKIVEPIIAFSIIITTLTAIYLNYKSYKNSENSNVELHHNLYFNAVIIFTFGLFHGLGFAGAFSALNIDAANYLVPLLSINLGVEFGQLFIIMITFPILWIVRNQKYGQVLLHTFSTVIVILALFWVIERLQ